MGNDAWDVKRAAHYDERVTELFGQYAALHARALQLVRHYVAVEDGTILVVGSGTGTEARAIAEAGYLVTGIDPSSAMVEQARQHKASAHTNYLVGHVEELPAEKQFAAATSLLVMHFLPDDANEARSKAAFLASIRARVRLGGLLILADLVGDPASPEFEKCITTWEEQVAGRSARPDLVPSNFQRLREEVHFVSEARLDHLLAEAGWKIEGTETFDGLVRLKWARS